MPTEQLELIDELIRQLSARDVERLRKPAGKLEMEQAYSETVTTGNTEQAVRSEQRTR